MGNKKKKSWQNNDSSAPETRHRIRLRFQKDGDLRFLGHRDLMNYMLRLLKVAKVQVAMSQGFHPKPKVSFPSALPLGVEGLNEIMELETAIEYNPVELQDALNACSASGLRFHSAQTIPETGRKKARPVSYTWRFPIPAGMRSDVQGKVTQIQSGCVPHGQKGRGSASEQTCFGASHVQVGTDLVGAESGVAQATNGSDFCQPHGSADWERRLAVVQSAVLDMSVVTQFSPSESEQDDDSEDAPLLKEYFLRFTLKADETQGAVTYKDILNLTGLTPVPETSGPAAGLTPLLRGTREDIEISGEE